MSHKYSSVYSSSCFSFFSAKLVTDWWNTFILNRKWFKHIENLARQVKPLLVPVSCERVTTPPVLLKPSSSWGFKRSEYWDMAQNKQKQRLLPENVKRGHVVSTRLDVLSLKKKPHSFLTHFSFYLNLTWMPSCTCSLQGLCQTSKGRFFFVAFFLFVIFPFPFLFSRKIWGFFWTSRCRPRQHRNVFFFLERLVVFKNTSTLDCFQKR